MSSTTIPAPDSLPLPSRQPSIARRLRGIFFHPIVLAALIAIGVSLAALGFCYWLAHSVLELPASTVDDGLREIPAECFEAPGLYECLNKPEKP